MKEIIYNTALFKDIPSDDFNELYKKVAARFISYKKGHLIEKDQNDSIGIVLSGKLHAMKYSIKGKAMFLRAISKGDIFAIGNVFNEKKIRLSYIEVIKDSSVVYIDDKDLLTFFENKQVLRNYLTYVNSKIIYLNQKIEIIAQDSIRDRVLIFIYNQWFLQNKNMLIKIDMTKNDLADYLGISRASLYRIIDDLKHDGILVWDKKRILIKRDLNEIF